MKPTHTHTHFLLYKAASADAVVNDSPTDPNLRAQHCTTSCVTTARRTAATRRQCDTRTLQPCTEVAGAPLLRPRVYAEDAGQAERQPCCSRNAAKEGSTQKSQDASIRKEASTKQQKRRIHASKRQNAIKTFKCPRQSPSAAAAAPSPSSAGPSPRQRGCG